jgi:hypothetical protein
MADKTITGTVRRASLEGGLWIVTTADGTTYQLRDAPDAMCRDGLAVQIVGEIDAGAVSIGMMGDTLRVKSFQAR